MRNRIAIFIHYAAGYHSLWNHADYEVANALTPFESQRSARRARPARSILRADESAAGRAEVIGARLDIGHSEASVGAAAGRITHAHGLVDLEQENLRSFERL